MTKGRAALPATVVAGKAFFITLGGPKAHDFSGRDDKREGCYSPGELRLGCVDFRWDNNLERVPVEETWQYGEGFGSLDYALPDFFR